MGILGPRFSQAQKAPRRVANNRKVTGPNQLWQMDIKYGYVAGLQRHFFLASIIDVFDRCIVAYYRGKACDRKNVIQVLHQAMLRRGIYGQEDKLENKLVIRTDNGSQFVSKDFRAFCEQTKRVEHEQIPVKTPNKNAYIESFHSIIERECFQRSCFSSYEEAFAEVDRFIRYYNHRRIHGSLKDHSPVEYMRLVQQGVIQPQAMAV